MKIPMTDRLEKMAGEFLSKHSGESPYVNGQERMVKDSDVATFAREIVKKCAESVCPDCRAGAQPTRNKTSSIWLHHNRGFDKCKAAPIWEGFGASGEK